MNIEIICPLYNAEKYIETLDTSLKKQKNVKIQKITYILTESTDQTEKILRRISAEYCVIKLEEFSHSLSREFVAMESTAGILVFITQDIIIAGDDWLYNLTYPIVNNEVEAAFSRQISKYNNIEKYTREKNYPEQSYTVAKKDIEKLGLRTFFFSDASSAIKAEVFKNLNGYDHKKMLTNEDQYIAYKLIMNGYRIKYCSDSIVFHSHNFTIKQLFKRYYAFGMFFKENSYLDQYGTDESGWKLAVYVLKRAAEDRNWQALIRFLPDMFARYLGMKVGKALYEK